MSNFYVQCFGHENYFFITNIYENSLLYEFHIHHKIWFILLPVCVRQKWSTFSWEVLRATKTPNINTPYKWKINGLLSLSLPRIRRTSNLSSLSPSFSSCKLYSTLSFTRDTWSRWCGSDIPKHVMQNTKSSIQILRNTHLYLPPSTYPLVFTVVI